MNVSTPSNRSSLREAKLPFKFAMETDQGFPHEGVLDFADNRVDATTGTIQVRGVVKNFARPPQGADTTLLQSVAAGECGVTIANHYYFLRLETSKSGAERDAANRPERDTDGPGENPQVRAIHKLGVR